MIKIIFSLASLVIGSYACADELLDLLDEKTSQSAPVLPEQGVKSTSVLPVIAESDLGKWVLELSKKETLNNLAELVQVADSDDYGSVAQLISGNLDIATLSDERRAIVGYVFLKSGHWSTALAFLSDHVKRTQVSKEGIVLIDREINKLPTSHFLISEKILNKDWVKPDAFFAYGWANLSADAPSEKLIELIQIAPTKKERETLFFRLGSQYVLEGQLPQAVKIFKKLNESAESADLRDSVSLQIARLLYAERHFGPSLDYYRKISSKSPYYFLAMEEKGWANLSLGLVKEQAESNHEILESPIAKMLTPEFYVQKVVGEIKMCQYSRALDTIVEFKAEIKKREQRIIELEKSCNENCFSVLERVYKASEMNQPLAEYRSLRSSSALRSRFEATKNFVGTNFTISTMSELRVGEKLVSEYLKSKQELAQRELSATVLTELSADREELRQSVNRMYVADAEVAQQVLLSDRKPIVEKNFTVQKPSLFSDKVTFKDDSEIWLDEISHYKVEKESICETK